MLDLTLHTMLRTLANRVVRQDRHNIRQVANARENEEKHGDALGALAAVVQQQLRHTRSQVERGADVPEDLAEHVELQYSLVLVLVFGLLGVALLARTVGAQVPASNAGGTNDENRGEVEQNGFDN